MGLGVVELVVLGVVALGLFSVLGIVGFKVLEGLLTTRQWEPDEIGPGARRGSNPDEAELMRDEQRWLGDRLTAVERRLPGHRKPLDGDPLDRLLEGLPGVDDMEGGDPPKND